MALLKYAAPYARGNYISSGIGPRDIGYLPRLEVRGDDTVQVN